ncbi:MAG TPA: TraR/DksA family transcriptional regulator [Rhodanobacter sp.]|jgi:DnaK suppressor protein|nr:TraR/DksA family transcriptional regulator [Rhodanobacter sp.]
MSSKILSKSGLDPIFIEAQRQRLEALLDQLIGSGDYAGRDEQIAQYESVDEVRDSGDSAETMAIHENDEATIQYTIRRLADVRRALEKIEQGTYGLSDVSGKPIGEARLLAIPEAVTAIAEEQALSK